HLGQLLTASGVAAELHLSQVPMLDRARELAAAGHVPGGTTRNLAASTTEWEADIAQVDRLLLADAQTSGGLLLAVPPAALDSLLEALAREATPAAAVIGRCLDGPPGAITVRRAP
ncbi:MAG TPA: AIR synthase-related protein, partial [Gemmatimonadales bacterium]|nr:AIR synthase-related protein [Gemmatimonadales bacterium]